VIGLHNFAFTQPDLIKSSVINSELKLIDCVFDSADSERMGFDFMGEIEVNIKQTGNKKRVTFFHGGFVPY
jgi:hypothetical protein